MTPKPWQERFELHSQRAILAAAIALLVLRFLWLGDAPFVIDEPLFQMLLDKYIHERQFPLTSFLGSSLPVPYGATALWFYAVPKPLEELYGDRVFPHARDHGEPCAVLFRNACLDGVASGGAGAAVLGSLALPLLLFAPSLGQYLPHAALGVDLLPLILIS